MSRRLVTMIVGAGLLLVTAVAGVWLRVPYAALGPGPTINTLGTVDGKEIISIDGRSANKTSGNLNLTTVSVTDHLDLLSALRGWIDGRSAVVPREELFPPGKSEEEVDKDNTADFVESQSNAETAALGELDATCHCYPLKVVVQSVPDDSPAKDRLRPDDVIESVNGTAITTFDELRNALNKVGAGHPATVAYNRDKKPGTAQVVLREATDGPKLGVTVATERIAPFTINIRVGEQIGGPSAGLMFALGIIDKIGADDLTGGQFIAGTGTIDDKGAVGPIGGIPLKMIAARDAGATVFLVPGDNCAEATANPPAGLRLVRVDTLHDAVTSLHALGTGGTVPTC